MRGSKSSHANLAQREADSTTALPRLEQSSLFHAHLLAHTHAQRLVLGCAGDVVIAGSKLLARLLRCGTRPFVVCVARACELVFDTVKAKVCCGWHAYWLAVAVADACSVVIVCLPGGKSSYTYTIAFNVHKAYAPPPPPPPPIGWAGAGSAGGGGKG